jgi:hypothetical protein
MLAQPCATRFATVDIGLNSLLKNRKALELLVLAKSVLEYIKKYANTKSTRDHANPNNLRDSFKEIKDLVLDDMFWTTLACMYRCLVLAYCFVGHNISSVCYLEREIT